jgi:alpha-galactosidase
MLGSLCIGADLNKWKPEDFGDAKQMVTEYKAMRDTIQRGALYRLVTPEHNSE